MTGINKNNNLMLSLGSYQPRQKKEREEIVNIT